MKAIGKTWGYGDRADSRVKLACPLGMEVAAEWVKTEEQEVLLAELGCDFARGYHFSEPFLHKGVPGFLGE